MFQSLRSLRFLLPLGVVLIVAGTKLWLIDRAATDLPYLDEWGAEGSVLIRPYVNGDLPAANFFWPHSEHRPVLTKAWTMLWFAANGQWDNRLQVVVNLPIYAATVWILWAFGASVFPRSVAGLAVPAVVLFAWPVSSENFLWGFQSQFLLLLLLGAGHVYGTLSETRLSARWWLAQVAGLLGVFSIAAGMMSAVALAGLALLALVRRANLRWAGATLLVNVAIAGLGLWLLPDAAASAPTKVHSAAQFLHSLGSLFAWPRVNPWFGLVIQLPMLVLLGRAVIRRDSDLEQRLTGLALWICLVTAAIAYGRGVSPGVIAGRYYDVLLVGIWANLLAVVLLVRAWPQTPVRLAVVFWTGLLVIGYFQQNEPSRVRNAPLTRKEFALQQAAAIRDFLQSDDPTVLTREPAVRDSFPHFQLTIDLLRDPAVRRILPPSVNADPHPGWLAAGAVRCASWWRIFLGLGLLAVVVDWTRRLAGLAGPSPESQTGAQ